MQWTAHFPACGAKLLPTPKSNHDSWDSHTPSPNSQKKILLLSDKKTWAQLLTCYWWTIMLLLCIMGPGLLQPGSRLGICHSYQQDGLREQIHMHIPCHFNNQFKASHKCQLTSCFSSGELLDLPCALSGLCLPCFRVPLALKDIPIRAGSAVRVLLIAV